MRASHGPIALAGNTIRTAESTTVVMVILTARIICLILESPIRARIFAPARLLLTGLSINLAEMWDETRSITRLSGIKDCSMSVNYVGIW